MDRFAEIKRTILDHAEKDEAICAVVAIGSSTRTEVKADEYSNLDLFIVTTDPDRWYSGEYPGIIGNVSIAFIEPTLGGGKEYRCIYEADLDVDMILLSPIYRGLAKGIELSDSFSWDTHKWLMQVYSCSTLVVKDKKNLLASFTEHPEYLADVSSSEHNDSWDLGPEMSRPARAIKLWYTLQATGTDLLAELIEYSFYNANLAKKELTRRPNWRIISNPSCGTINFRYEPEGLTNEELDELTARISKELIGSGFAYIVTTVLRGMKTLRMCIINANTTEEDVIQTIALLDEIAVKETASLLEQRI